MKRNKLFIVCSFLLATSNYCIAQDYTKLTLDSVIISAQSNSPSYKLSYTRNRISEYQYYSFKSDYKPQINFFGNLPVYTKEFATVVQPDGSIGFIPIRQNISNIGMGISQRVISTGGDISFNSDLSRFDDFRSGYKQYNGTPIFLKYTQPLLGLNNYKWDKKIQPLKYEESKRTFIQEKETIAQTSVQLYFDALNSQIDISIHETNLLNSENNLEIEKKRINLGTTNEDKILQLELQVLNNKQQLEKAKYTLQISQLALQVYSGLNEISNKELQLPEKIPDFNINIDDALLYARNNRPEFIAFERKRLESGRDLNIAKTSKQQISLLASYGFNRASENLPTIYTDANSQQRFSIGFSLPVVDWGRRKYAIKTAESTKKLNDYNNEIDEININQQIITIVKNLILLKNTIKLSQQANSVAERRFTIAYEIYQTGKLSLIELNIAQNEKDNSKRSVIDALRSFWETFYLLRRLTLYDFVNQRSLYQKNSN